MPRAAQTATGGRRTWLACALAGLLLLVVLVVAQDVQLITAVDWLKDFVSPLKAASDSLDVQSGEEEDAALPALVPNSTLDNADLREVENAEAQYLMMSQKGPQVFEQAASPMCDGSRCENSTGTDGAGKAHQVFNASDQGSLRADVHADVHADASGEGHWREESHQILQDTRLNDSIRPAVQAGFEELKRLPIPQEELVPTPEERERPLLARRYPRCNVSNKNTPNLGVWIVNVNRMSGDLYEHEPARQVGLELVSRRHEADIVVMQYTYARKGLESQQKLLDQGIKLILLARADSVDFASDHPLLAHPGFLGIFKEFTHRRLGDYMQPRWDGRLSYFRICNSTVFRSNVICTGHWNNNKGTNFWQAPELLPQWSKVHAVNWNWNQYYQFVEEAPRLNIYEYVALWRISKKVRHALYNASHEVQQAIMSMPVPQGYHRSVLSNIIFNRLRAVQEDLHNIIDRQRDIDVFMAVHIRNDPASLARTQVSAALDKYEGVKRIYFCLDKAGRGSFPKAYSMCLNGRSYTSFLRRSKVVICPWGFGERTSCEHGGWMAGAVVVKPWSDWVLAYPDVYRAGATYIPVKPDYSDLAEKVKTVVSHWADYREMRVSVRDFFMNTSTRANFSDHFWNTVCRAVKSGGSRLREVPDTEDPSEVE